MPAMDPAIAKALSLEEPLPEMEVHGDSGFSSTYKITSKVDGETKIYFVKTGGPDSKTMFAGKFIWLWKAHAAEGGVAWSLSCMRNLANIVPRTMSLGIPYHYDRFAPSNIRIH